MHELSIATGIVNVATEAAGAATVERVTVRVGDLSGVVADALEFAWDVATSGTALDGAALEIERMAGAIECAQCGTTTELDVPPRFRCRKCDAPCPDVIRGRELEVLRLELADECAFDDPSCDDAPNRNDSTTPNDL